MKTRKYDFCNKEFFYPLQNFSFYVNSKQRKNSYNLKSYEFTYTDV